MKKLPCGRAHWEYESNLDRYGTPMALMLLPYWTNGCIDWWCYPHFDSPSIFGAILDDEKGGHFTIEPLEPCNKRHRPLR